MKIACFTDSRQNMYRAFFEGVCRENGWECRFISSYDAHPADVLVSFQPDAAISLFRFDNKPIGDLLASLQNSETPPVPFFVLSQRREERSASADRMFPDSFQVKIVNKDSLAQSLILLEKEVLEAQKSASDIDKKTILYVDDSSVMHSFFADALQDSPYQIIDAYSGEEGLKLYKETLPDMVITDVEMPHMSGLELCREIKENNFENRFIPVVILSSKEEPMDIETGFKYGADDYLTKPVSRELLLDKIEEYLSAIDRKSSSRVLVVEYDRVHNEKISHIVIKSGLTVLRAFDVQTAMLFLEQDVPDVMIISLDIPESGGFQFIRSIRSNEGFTDLAIIGVANKPAGGGRKEVDVENMAVKYGVEKVFYKPFNAEHFAIVLERILSEKYASYKRENRLILDIISLLISSLEARDEYTRGHTERVSKYSILLGKQMKLSAREMDVLEKAAKFHDLGKIGIRDDILLKQAKLTEGEYLKIQEHATIGAKILEPLASYRDVIPLILHHHERWDGKGYPAGIQGNAIPLGARIIAVADSYDAMTTDRPYRKALKHERAIQIIRENTGTQFCPRCVEAFLQIDEWDLAKIRPDGAVSALVNHDKMPEQRSSIH